MAASPSKRRRILAEGAPDLASLALETAQGCVEDAVNAAETVVASVARRQGKARERYLGGAKAAATARRTREKKVLSSATPGPADRDADLVAARPPGLMLVHLGFLHALGKATRLRFRVVNDPVDFLAGVAKQQNSNAGRRSGNVVLVQTADADTDFGIAAKIAAAFTGAFFTTPDDFAKGDFPEGIQYTEKLRSSKATYHVAATASLEAQLPTLPHLLRTLAQTPRVCVKFYLKPKKLCKWVKKEGKGAPRLMQRACVLCQPGEEHKATKSWKPLYTSPSSWILRFSATVQARCPGT